MNEADLRVAWIEALEGGQYRQTGAMLHGPTGYCCLGVACDVADPSGWGEEDDLGYIPYRDQYFTGLPPDLYQRLGLNAEMVAELVSMNDCEKKSFADIASRLRKEWNL